MFDFPTPLFPRTIILKAALSPFIFLYFIFVDLQNLLIEKTQERLGIRYPKIFKIYYQKGNVEMFISSWHFGGVFGFILVMKEDGGYLDSQERKIPTCSL